MNGWLSGAGCGGGENNYKRGTRELFDVTEMFYISIVVVII